MTQKTLPGAPDDADAPPDACPTRVRNLFDEAAPPARGERFDTLLRQGRLMIERIVSSAQVEPREYVQIQDEWALMVQGKATLRIGERVLELESGDHVFLPAGTPHCVETVSPGALWLAVHLYPE